MWKCWPSLTFTLSVEGGVTATDAAIVVVADASFVNTAFWKKSNKTKQVFTLYQVLCDRDIGFNLQHLHYISYIYI